jgi:putative DNA primase/helicase
MSDDGASVMTLKGYDNSPVVQQFTAAMARRGLLPPEKFIADGKLHRCNTTAKNGRGDGSYLLHLDGTIPAGGFQNWQDGKGWENWHFDPGRRPLTVSERNILKHKIAGDATARQEAETRTQIKVQEKAQRLLNGAPAADDAHEYLRSKKISPWGARLLYGCLVVPLFDANGVLQNLQFISADGRKRYLKGASVQGCFYRISGDPRKICIAEGFATAATIRAATGFTAIVAFDAGNLRAVAEAVARAADDTEIIIAADDDWKRKGGNVGIEKATAAAAAIGAKIASPDFGQNRRDKDTDFNDLAEFMGLDAVRRCIEEAVAEEPELKEADVNSEIARLAQLSPIEYDRVRSDVARRLKVRLGTLDQAVTKVHCESSDVHSDLPHWNVEPWPTNVDGAQLLDELAAIFHRYVILPRFGAETLALWVVHAWALDASDISPFLVLKSPVMRCGKTTVLVLVQFLTPKSELASNITPAAIFRYIEQERPTLIFDEADTFVNSNDEMRGILNSGHTRASAYVIRTVEIGGDHVAKRFSTWAAKAIAGIGSLADTIADRSITLVMQRKTRDQKVNRLRRRDSPEFGEIRRKALRWTEDNLGALTEADDRTEVPAQLHDRAADNWRPLLTIADRAGGSWPDIARKAALALSGFGCGRHIEGSAASRGHPDGVQAWRGLFGDEGPHRTVGRRPGTAVGGLSSRKAPFG